MLTRQNCAYTQEKAATRKKERDTKREKAMTADGRLSRDRPLAKSLDALNGNYLLTNKDFQQAMAYYQIECDSTSV